MAAIPAALSTGHLFSAEALPLCAGTACACAALLAWARSLGTKGARRDGEEHGSSRWATRKDIAPFGDPKDPDNNIILTDNARIRLVSRRFDLSTDTNDNVLVVGGPGTGKTRYFVKPNLLQANASFFVTDPKGTLIREMGGALAELGYEIRAFDTIDFSRSMRFNPIAYIRDEAGVIRFARGLVANTEGEADHKGDPYWEKAERLVYTALTAYLARQLGPYAGRVDAAVLGCTHFPFVRRAIRAALGGNVTLYDGSDGTARETLRQLVRRGWVRGGSHGVVTLENSLPSELPLSRWLLALPRED